MKCRSCGSDRLELFVDLGMQPPSNSYISMNAVNSPEVYFPLKCVVCKDCFLVQTVDYVDASVMFNDEYAYLSSASSSWLEHCKTHANLLIDKCKLNASSFVIELASNDGYMLQNFHGQGIRCLGVEPTLSTARISMEKGINTLCDFFSEEIGKKISELYGLADVVIANNVYAHVPNINDFTRGVSLVLKDDGVCSIEFPHLYSLIKGVQFDTIYHEHYSYLSLSVVMNIFLKNGLKVHRVEKLPTHGGSLRIWGSKVNSSYRVDNSVHEILREELDFGLGCIDTYKTFQNKVERIKFNLLNFLLNCKKNNKKVIGYGAAAKGNTLLNYSGVKSDLISYVCDASILKQGKLLPGSRIPIVSPDELKDDEFDYVLILPWNIKNEIMGMNKHLNYKYVTAIPELETFE